MQKLQNGEIFDGKYQVVKTLGHGGMGTVYQAVEIELQRQVAIKLVHEQLLLGGQHRARFERESKIVSDLKHPNIATFYRFGIVQNIPFIVMELLSGEPLPNLIQNTALPVPACLSIATQLCSALHYAHMSNVVHRDVKPSNVIIEKLGDDYIAKLLDFGLAFTLAEENQKVTQTGELVGSLHYMSPEQCMHSKVDARSDIYSLGCLIYETLTGCTPFTGDNPIALMKQHVSDAPPDLKSSMLQATEPEVIAALDSVIKRALAKNPDDRYQTMEALKVDLDSIAEGKTERIRHIAASSQVRKKYNRKILLAITGCIALATGYSFFLQKKLPFLNANVSEMKAGLSLHARIWQMTKMTNNRRRLETAQEIAKEIRPGTTLPGGDISELYNIIYTDGVGVLPPELLIKQLDQGIQSSSNPMQACHLIHKKALVYLNSNNHGGVALCTDKMLSMLDKRGIKEHGLTALALITKCKSNRLQGKAQPALIPLIESTANELRLREQYGVLGDLASELAFVLLLSNRDAEEETLFVQTTKDLERASLEDQRTVIVKWLDTSVSIAKQHNDQTRFKKWLAQQRNKLSETQWKNLALWLAQMLINRDYPSAAIEVTERLPVPAAGKKSDDGYRTKYLKVLATALMQLRRKAEAEKLISQILALDTSELSLTDMLILAAACAKQRDYSSVERLMELHNKRAVETEGGVGENSVNQCINYCNVLPPERRAELGLKQIEFTRKQLLDRKMMCDLWRTQLDLRQSYFLALQGNYKESQSCLKALIDSNPVIAKPVLQDLQATYALALFSLNRDQEAQVQVSVFLAESNLKVPPIAAAAYIRLANEYDKCGKFEQAEKYYLQALNNSVSNYLLGFVTSRICMFYDERGEHLKSLKMSERIQLEGTLARLRPLANTWKVFYLRKAVPLRIAGRFDQAMEALNKAQAFAEMDERVDKVPCHIEKYLCFREKQKSAAKEEIKHAHEAVRFDTPVGNLQLIQAAELDAKADDHEYHRWQGEVKETLSQCLREPDSIGTLDALNLLRQTCAKHGRKDLEIACLNTYNQAQSIIYGPQYATKHALK